MPRHARLDAPGTLHHVMAREIDQTNIFVDDADRAKFLGIVELVNESGVSLTEVARLIGISPSGVGNVLKRVQADR